MESGIEASDLRHVGKKPGDGVDAFKVVRLVQRRQGDKFFELAALRVADEAGSRKWLPP
jgi:hypothetical protein